MKGLIRKILKEEVGGDALSRLRLILTKMKSIEGWEKVVYDINKFKKVPGGIQEKTEGLWSLLKYMGFSPSFSVQSVRLDTIYWFSTTFMKNGGYDRDFREGEIQLPELPVYEMSGGFTEKQYVYKTGWGDMLAVSNEEEAIDIFTNDIDEYIEDSEEEDRDYGDSYDVENVVVQNIRMIKFDPQWVGL